MEFLTFFKVLILLVLSLCSRSLSKDCDNNLPKAASHTFRYELATSKNETWKKEMHEMMHHHNHPTPTDDSAWSNLLPRKMTQQEEFDWAMMYRKIKGQGGDANELTKGFLKAVPLTEVRLDPNSIYGVAQQTNLEYLLILDVDNLVWSFRKTAGLPTPGTPYGGWEEPKQELRGHFVGHYMSASAKMWATTRNETLRKKMSAIVSALSECQEKFGNGYLSAFPTELFDRVEALQYAWAPYYTMHKIMAGLLDQYSFAGNHHALRMLNWMVDYFYNRVQNVIRLYSIERHYASLNEESGGMNDVLYNLYKITNNPKHLVLGHLFDKPCFLGLLAIQSDELSGFHSNTHIPVVVGAQMRYEITGDPLYKEIGTYFIDMLNSSHTYATGGSSVNEHWTEPKRLATTLSAENEESCTTYNTLKISRNLFKWTKEIAYADHYERALTNGVLSIQRGKEPGVMIYMLPLERGASKGRSDHGWGDKYNTFWCCYGTATESFSKLGDSIYFEEEGKLPALYIIQYIPSSFNWKYGQILLDLKVNPVVAWDPRLRVTITIASEKARTIESTLNFRIPVWAYENESKASINDQYLDVPMPGNYLSITRKWSPGDKIYIELPISLRTEAIKDDRPEYVSIQAILYGQYLLAGRSTGDWDIETENAQSLSDWIHPIPEDYNAHLITLSQKSMGNMTFVLGKTNRSISMDHSIYMENYPELGTDAADNSTLRIILQGSTAEKFLSAEDAVGKVVMLESYNLPGFVLAHQGRDKPLKFMDKSGNFSLFHMVAGLDGRNGTVSFESEDSKGCYIYSHLAMEKQAGALIDLRCMLNPSDSAFKQAVSFDFGKGISQYHPISFIAKGKSRKFLLAPLLSLMDESYTVYFNLTNSVA